MKKILSIMLTLCMIIGIAQMPAFAANDVGSTFFPSGKISAPTKALVLVYDRDEENSYADMMDIVLYQTDDIIKLGDEYSIDEEAFLEKYGLFSIDVYTQIDGRLDNGSWQCKDCWDNLEDDDSLPYYLVSRNQFSVGCSSDKQFNATLSDLYYIDNEDFEGYAGWLSDGLIPFTDEYGETKYHYDMDNHTFSYRYRFVVSFKTAEDWTDHVIVGDWSPEISIGKNATQNTPVQLKDLPAPVLKDFSLVAHEDDPTHSEAHYYIDLPKAYADGETYYLFVDEFEPYYMQAELKIDDNPWEEVYTANPTSLNNGFRSTSSANYVITKDSRIQVRVRIHDNVQDLWSPYSNIVGTTAAWANASAWAEGELENANELDLIPDVLKGSDLTKDITRAEFAAVAVKVYEALSGTAAVPAETNPFADTNDADVLKAYNIGAVNGTSATTYDPNALLNREQAAAMLTRVFKKVTIEGWSLAADGQFALQFDKPEIFADDEQISAWAKDSVYFMVANGIINGVGGNKFAPKNVTTEEQAIGYANATREQALLIAVRMVNNLK